MLPDVAPVQIVHDCDPGIDDALALAVIADAVRGGRARLAAVVAVGGNVGLDHTAANVGFLASRFGLAVPTLAGSAEPLAGGVSGDAAHVHGDDGIGGLRTDGDWIAPRAASPTDLVDVLAELDQDAGPRVLLATGPLTNLARMIDEEPDLARLLDRVVVMGGAFGDPPGNATAHAEFNVWIDPEAWAVVAGAGLPLDIVPLDVTTKVVLDRGDLPRFVRPDGSSSLVGSIVRAGIDLYDTLLGTPMCEMHDPLAAAVLLRPDLLSWTAGEVTVVTDGDQRGATRLRPDESSRTRVALGVEVSVARAALVGALERVDDR